MVSVQRNKGLCTSKSLLAAAVCLVMASQAQALQLDFGEDSELSGNLDMTLGYAASIRATDADLSPGALATAPNVASDLRVPDAGDLISNVFKVNAELGIDWRNYGLVSNFAYQYDTEIMDGDQADIGLANGSNWTRGAESYSGSAFDVLDAYVYGTFDVGESPLELRVGKQVINWGEGLFFLDGVSTQVPLNINKLVTPGSELKEAYIGVEGIYAQMGVGDASSLEAYVQTNWRRTEFPPHATFYGDDAFFRGGQETGLRDSDIEADEKGQWGISGRTTVGDDTEVGLYYSRYHETFPFVQITTPGSASDLGSILGLQQVYPEDLEMIGASMATTLGDWSVNGEIAYRPDRPLFTNLATFNAAGRNIEEHDTVSASVHGIWLGGALPLGIDSQVALVQFGADYIDGDLSNLQANSSITKEVLTPDDLAYGVAVEWIGTWQAIRPGVDLSLDLFLQHDIEGNSHFWGNFAEDRWLGAATLTANIGNEWEASAGYSWIDQDNSHYETQDVYNLSVNYKF
ncbi:MAG: DUF1302 family protein [Amphritea sp.]